MKVRLGLLREFLYEAVLSCPASGPSAPTDDDARVPGHLPNELPKSASLEDDGLDEEAVVPGRWAPNGYEPEPYDHERLGDPTGSPSGAEASVDVGGDDLDETDDRMLGDGKGNGIPDPNTGDDEIKISPHLVGDDEKLSLGSPPEEKPERHLGEDHAWLKREIKRYMLQEDPAGTSLADPNGAKGFYSDFDMEKDHHTGADIQGLWYKSPGREPGTEGDPFRVEDPASRLKMHPDENDPTTVHPAVSGEEGWDALRAPAIGALTGGDDTSTMLGANAKPGAPDVGSDGEPEEDEEGEGGDAQGDEAEGEEQG